MPNSVNLVSNFDVQNYVGKWYQIARLDHSLKMAKERGFDTDKLIFVEHNLNRG